MLISKDIYLYLTNFIGDDKTILNMLSVNKKFHNEELFKKVIERKYPLLVTFKDESETWKNFYINNIFYMSALNKKFGIPYIQSKDYNPKELYIRYKEYKLEKLRERGKTSYRDFKEDVKIFVLNISLEYAANSPNIKIMKYLIEERGANGFTDALSRHLFDIEFSNNWARFKPKENINIDTIKYLVEKGADISQIYDIDNEYFIQHLLEKGVPKNLLLK